MSDDPETLRTEVPGDERPSASDLKTFRKVEERFELGEELGRGGMGRVVDAKDVALRRNVAIKQVLTTNEHDLIRFEREVRITAELEHPSIVPIHDIGTDDVGRPYYVMRRIRGKPLSDRIAKLRDLGARLALLPNVLAVADAAAFAHARRIIHRDIKPSNILLGDYGETLLIDWGLARRVDEPDDQVPVIPDSAASLPGDQLTHTGHVYGTTGYMAPEQARGEHVDARADVYALGATLFHVLHGRGPYDGQSAAERISAAALGEPPPIEKLPADTPPELRAIVTKAMANEPEARYRDAGGFAVDLRAFLDGRLVAAHSYTAVERAKRFVRRHRGAVIVAVLATAILMTGSVLAVRDIVEKKDDAEHERRRAEIEMTRAQDRYQLVLLERASTVAESDPVRAIALLRHIPAESPYVRRARDIAAKANARGISHGSAPRLSMVTALTISPDGKRLASGDADGFVFVHDVTTGRRREIAQTKHRVSTLVWLDGGKTLATPRDPKGLILIDVESGTHRTVDHDVPISSLVASDPDDRVRYVDDASESLIELVPTTGERRVVATGVTAATGMSGIWLLMGSSGLRMLAGDRETALSTKAPRFTDSLAIDARGDRIAAAIDHEVIEWDRTGAELRRWSVRYAFRPSYTPHGLCVMSLESIMWRLGDKPTELFRERRQQIIGSTETSAGLVFTLDTGKLTVVDELGARDLPFKLANTHRLAGLRGKSLIALATRDGEIRWFDLRTTLPEARQVGAGFLPCMIEPDRILAFEQVTQLVEVDRKTWVKRLITDRFELGTAICLGRVQPDLLAFAGPAGLGVVNTKTGDLKLLDNVDGFHVDPETHTVFAGRGPDLVEAVNGVPPGKVIWKAPANIVAIAGSKSWIAVKLSNHSLVRIERATGTRVTIPCSKDAVFTVGDNGVVWFVEDRAVSWWAGGSPVVAGRASHPIVDVGVGDQEPVVVKLTDLSLWAARRGAFGLTRISNSGRPLALGTHDIAVLEDAGSLVTLMVSTRERITREVPLRVNFVLMADRGRTLLVALRDGWMVIYNEIVPVDPIEARGWIDATTTTNATIDVDTDVMTWSN